MNFNSFQLKELASIQTGPFGSQLHKEDYCETGTPIVTVEHLGKKNFSSQNLPKVSEHDVERLKKYLLKTGDIVFSRVGSVDRCSYVSNNFDKWLFSGRCLRVRVASETLNPEYLYYYFCQNNIKEYVRNIAVGSTMPSINTKIMGEIPIKFPSRENQDKIVSILSSFDDKIETNKQIINNLDEQIALAFEQTFLSQKRSKTRTLSELVERSINGDWGKDSPQDNHSKKVLCIRGTDINQIKAGFTSKVPTRYILPKNFESKKLLPGDLVIEVSGGTPVQSTGRAILLEESLVQRLHGDLVCTNFCKALKIKEDFNYFFYSYWNYLYSKGFFFNFENGTTGIKNLDIKSTLTHIKFPEPTTKELDEFNRLASNFMRMQSNLSLEISTLSDTRDTLLPWLMSK